jgi:hypothetical protein
MYSLNKIFFLFQVRQEQLSPVLKIFRMRLSMKYLNFSIISMSMKRFSILTYGFITF